MDPLSAWSAKLNHLCDVIQTSPDIPEHERTRIQHSVSFVPYIRRLLMITNPSAANSARDISRDVLLSTSICSIDHVCAGLWHAITSAAAEIGSNEGYSARMADLLYELCILPPASAPVGDTAAARKKVKGVTVSRAWYDKKGMHAEKFIPPNECIKWNGQILWQDLPGFGPMMDARKSCHHHGCQPLAPTNFSSFPWPDGRRTEARWLAFNTFLATLIARYSENSDLIACYTHYAICAIASALEYPAKGSHGRGWRSVSAACVWFEIAAKQVRSLVTADEIGAAGPDWAKHDDSGKMTKERWGFWGKRLKGYLRDERLSGERQRVQRAVEAWETASQDRTAQ